MHCDSCWSFRRLWWWPLWSWWVFFILVMMMRSMTRMTIYLECYLMIHLVFVDDLWRHGRHNIRRWWNQTKRVPEETSRPRQQKNRPRSQFTCFPAVGHGMLLRPGAQPVKATPVATLLQVKAKRSVKTVSKAAPWHHAGDLDQVNQNIRDRLLWSKALKWVECQWSRYCCVLELVWFGPKYTFHIIIVHKLWQIMIYIHSMEALYYILIVLYN